jgi:hypothetical protein
MHYNYEGVRSHFHVLRFRIHFRQYRDRPVYFSCFMLPDLFSDVPRVSGPVFMFCAPRLLFGGNEGFDSNFHVLRSRNHFQRYKGRHIQFSCFALLDSFSTIPQASGPVFMFYASRLIFDGNESIGSVFMFCAPRLIFGVPRALDPVFKFCTHILIFRSTERVGSIF